MADIIEQLENLEFKIKQLARKVELIKDENVQLVKENTEIRELLDQKQRKESSTAQAIEFEGERNSDIKSEKIKAELDTYIEEIDHCIQLLESL